MPHLSIDTRDAVRRESVWHLWDRVALTGVRLCQGLYQTWGRSYDRIVILGHVPLLTRPENIIHFFQDVHQSCPITKDVLRKRTGDYNRWVEAFAAIMRSPWNGSACWD
jgi:hypothetical protein